MDSKPKARILLAEDSSTVACAIRLALERVGYSVTVAGDGSIALLMAQTDHFDLVITDEQMPQMNGRDLCRQLRADPRYARTPIIFVTSKRLEVISDIIKEVGRRTPVISKPVRPQALVKTVEELLGLRTANR